MTLTTDPFEWDDSRARRPNATYRQSVLRLWTMTERAGIAAVRDADLVQRAAGGDVAAFETLVAERLTRALWTASATLGNAADAHDVAQDAFVATWRHLPALRDAAKFDA